MKRLSIERIGPIQRADVEFGDLTVLVGPQASGKSIFLQWLLLLEDTSYVRKRLAEYGISWQRELGSIIETFFGEGTASMWRGEPDSSRITIDGSPVENVASLLTRGGKRQSTSRVFYIPAQRAITLRDGWPRPFSDFGPGDPFAVRDFSDRLRILLEGLSRRGTELFPKSNKLKAVLRQIIDRAVFRGFGLRVDEVFARRRLVLSSTASAPGLPFMTWSAGQREFVPLLLGLYWLLPSAKVTRRRDIELVIIEEPEMGLHPRAVAATMLLVFELLWRGYRVCMATHSPHVLDVLWGIRSVKMLGGSPQDVIDLFGVSRAGQLVPIAETALTKNPKVYFFDEAGMSCDITELDPGSDSPVVRGWGGLTGFSEQVAEVVARLAT